MALFWASVLGLPAVPAGDELSGGTILALKMTGGPILASGGPILASLRTEGWHRFGLSVLGSPAVPVRDELTGGPDSGDSCPRGLGGGPSFCPSFSQFLQLLSGRRPPGMTGGTSCRRCQLSEPTSRASPHQNAEWDTFGEIPWHAIASSCHQDWSRPSCPDRATRFRPLPVSFNIGRP